MHAADTENGNAADEGIIPRAVVDLFKGVDQLRTQGVKASVHASFLEVMNEDIKDLIGGGGSGTGGAADGACLKIREDNSGDVAVKGLSQHKIAGAKDLGILLKHGALCRATAPTNMNKR